MRSKGKITSWNDEKGFGFISPVAGGKRVFVHIKAFENRKRRPEIGELLSYRLATDKQGRPCAADVLRAGERFAKNVKIGNGFLSVIGAVAFLVIVGISVSLSKIPLVVFLAYLILSLLTLVIYAIDKSAARKGEWRTSESTLHLLTVFGGWPGAVIAQRWFRHKSRKQSFRVVFWLTVGVNCAIFIWGTSDQFVNLYLAP